MPDFLDSMYRVRAGERRAFGDAWCGPDRFDHCEETLVARYIARRDSDGLDTEVYCTAAPARFYTIKALSRPDSVGRNQLGFVLRTGSSDETTELTARIAVAISEGMLDLVEKSNES